MAKKCKKTKIVSLLLLCIIFSVFFLDSDCSYAKKMIPTAAGAKKYNKSKWIKNKDRYKATNCYAYALDMVKKPGKNGYYFSVKKNRLGIQPGDLISPKGKQLSDFELAKSVIYSFFAGDMKQIGYKIKELKGEKLYKKIKNKKTYLVYLATTSIKNREFHYYSSGSKNKIGTCWVEESDYHWYRQDKDGIWSHKMGFTKNVSKKDTNNKKIKNPKIAKKEYVISRKNKRTKTGLFYDENGYPFRLKIRTKYDGKSGFYSIKTK